MTPTAGGRLLVGPSGPATNASQVVSYRAARTRAGHTIAWLGNDGALAVTADLPSGSTHVVLDVAGYFE